MEQSSALAPDAASRRASATLPPFALGPILGIAALVATTLLMLSERYGYLSDELYFLAAGKYYLDWGYMDQQPLVPLLAAGIDAIAPGSLLALRLPSVLVTVLGIALTALIAREFGGDRRAQTLAAAAYPLAPWLLISGHWLTAATLEPAQWATIVWLLVRWVRLRHAGITRDRLLLFAGVVTVLAVQTKFHVLLLCVAIVGSIAVTGPRALLGRPSLWIGASLVVLTSLPTFWWQAAHGWPAREMSTTVASESDRLLLLPTALLYSGVIVGAVLACYGFWQLIRSPLLADYRFLGAAILAVVVGYLIISGRPNYLAAVYAPLFAAGAVGLGAYRTRSPRPRWSWVAWPAYLLSATLAVAFLPIYPLPLLARHPELPNASRLYETGWTDLAHTAARSYRALPPSERDRTAVVGETYHIAGALDIHGRALGLPRTYSPHRGYWFFGHPPESAETVLYVGNRPALDHHFRTRIPLGTVRTEQLNLAQGVQIVRYTDPNESWARIWPAIRRR